MNNDERLVISALQTVFGYEDFKNELQKQATILVYEGLKHVFISIPPGFDRSLCFELPAILKKGKVAIVFSPELCFMKNRVDFFRNKQIKVHLLSLSTKPKKRDIILRDFSSNYLTTPLLYATPEMIMIKYFQVLISSLQNRKLLSYIVFNEAHFLSEWKYKYTPFYKNASLFNPIFGNVPRVAVTTSVTNKVINDICKLVLKDPKKIKIDIQQENVYYDVWFLDILSHPFEHLRKFIIDILGFLNQSVHKVHDNFGIVYCKEANTAELLTNKLVAVGIATLTCHHRLNKGTRCNIENQWISGKAKVIVTTYDYGFIHRKSIKCKVYWTVPENIPKYYRESIQSFTNNCRAYCRIYFSTKEYSSIKMFIENHKAINNLGHIEKRLSEYNKLVSYCLSTKCRYAVISEYFGKEAGPCKICDVCEDMDAVKIRTLKFIAYSEKVKKIKYDICDINEDIKGKIRDPDVEKRSQECSEEESKKCNVAQREISVDRNNSVAIVQYRDKQKSSPPSTRSSIEDYIHASSGNPVKCAEDNSNATGANELAITCSLLSKCNLNNVISLEPCSSKNSNTKIWTRFDNTQVSSETNVSHIKSRIKDANSDARASTVEKRHRITRSDSCETILVGPGGEERREKRHKRCGDADTCPAEFSSKRRKFETQNKPTAVTRDRRRSKETSDRDKRVEDDANESMSRGHAIAEYLMNKYKLNRDSITLKPCRK